MRYFVVAIAIALSAGCAPRVDPAIGDCSKIISANFDDHDRTQPRKPFADYDLETQFSIFICGSQFKHPPLLHLVEPLAAQGEPMAHFLFGKLAASNYDLTIRDIAFAYEEMSRQGTYDILDHEVVWTTLRQKVSQHQNSPWFSSMSTSLSAIQAAHSNSRT